MMIMIYLLILFMLISIDLSYSIAFPIMRIPPNLFLQKFDDISHDFRNKFDELRLSKKFSSGISSSLPINDEDLSYDDDINEIELKKLKDAIKMFQKKIEKQGRVTNARDEDHLSNLIKLIGKSLK